MYYLPCYEKYKYQKHGKQLRGNLCLKIVIFFFDSIPLTVFCFLEITVMPENLSSISLNGDLFDSISFTVFCFLEIGVIPEHLSSISFNDFSLRCFSCFMTSFCSLGLPRFWIHPFSVLQHHDLHFQYY